MNYIKYISPGSTGLYKILTYINLQKSSLGASKMDEYIRALVPQSSDLSLIPQSTW